MRVLPAMAFLISSVLTRSSALVVGAAPARIATTAMRTPAASMGLIDWLGDLLYDRAIGDSIRCACSHNHMLALFTIKVMHASIFSRARQIDKRYWGVEISCIAPEGGARA